jgi:hydrogenase maturation protein HypF
VGTHPAGARVAPVRLRLRVEGIVQGVGFRPFVHGLAIELGVNGFVGNDAEGVFAEAEGPRAAVERFVAAVRQRAPALAVVERMHAVPIDCTGEPGFTIAASPNGGVRRALVTADSATCAKCLREVLDPDGRRASYPFTNCTNCGPRFSIVVDIPYDRANTTMATFAMCAACAAEYDDPADRRFHAQPTCCPACGPRLEFRRRGGAVLSVDPLAATADALLRGAIVAVKGPRRLPPRGRRGERARSGNAARPQAPGGAPVRADGARPRRGWVAGGAGAPVT